MLDVDHLAPTDPTDPTDTGPTAPAGTDPATGLDRAQALDLTRRHVSRGTAALAELTGAAMEVASAGSRVWDEHGTAHLDCGGYGVFLLGHRHPAVVAAVRDQLERHPLATKALVSPVLAQAAAALASVTPPGLDHVTFTNSGAEATELALKLARLAGARRVVAMRSGYHGKTLGALSVTGREPYRAPFAPLLPDVDFVDFGDIEALDVALAATPPGTACVVLEPLQAEGGVRIPPPDYLAAVRRACDAHRAVMVLDEIQTGLGRLGTWWGAGDVRPDVLLVGKTLSGGVMPVAATVATREIFAPLDRDPLLHSSTFAGNPLAAAAVTATVTALRDEGLVDRSARLGERLLALVRERLAARCPDVVVDVRGRGLLIGIELAAGDKAVELLMAMLERRVLTSYSLNSHSVVRLTPPAVLSDDDVAWLADALDHAAAQLA